MKYLNFSFENYKGIIEKITIGNKNSLSCLVGNNESGKTTILKGIDIIGKLCRGDTSKIVPNDFIPRKQGASFNGKIIFSTEIQLNDEEINTIPRKHKSLHKSLQTKKGLLEISFTYNFYDSVLKDGLDTSVKGFSNANNLVDLIKGNSPEIIYYDEFKFVVPEKIRFLRNELNVAEIGTDKKVLLNDPILNGENNRFWHEVFNNILVGAVYQDNDKKKETFQEKVVDESNSVSVDTRINKMQNYLNTFITQDWQDVTGNGAKFESFQIERIVGNGSNDFNDYRIKAKANDLPFTIPEKSKGCQWYFCFKIYTIIKSKADKGNGIIFLLDEPASNLHIHPQEKILESLKDLSKQDNTSVIYSTHTPFLTDYNNKENTYVVDNKTPENYEGTEIISTLFDDYEGSLRTIEPFINKSILDIPCLSKEKRKKYKELFEKWYNRADRSTKIAKILEYWIRILSEKTTEVASNVPPV